ncbi:MAG: AAC(3)-I family aminoglycoside N-acetyltransferase [Cyanobacteria bacterium J06614_10]
MSAPSHCRIRQLTADDIALVDALLLLFGEACDDLDTYTSKKPSPEYVRQLLESDYFLALVALEEETVVGGIIAYELKKFEQERSEIYLYDLAVAAAYRRKGIATRLIEELRKIAAIRDAYVIFVQANTDIEDQPAIALYTKLGTREEVLHFDIAVKGSDTST